MRVGGWEGRWEGGNERGGGKRGYVTMKGVIINCCVNSDQVTTKSYNKSTVHVLCLRIYTIDQNILVF